MTTVGDGLFEYGGVPVGLLKELCPAKVMMLAKADTNTYSWWYPRWKRNKFFTQVSKAEDACTTKQNDTILVTPESHVWYGEADVATAALTWDKQNTHMIGMAPFTKGGGMRSRFGHSGSAMANFMTVSGSNNMFANLYWMHGSATGAAADVNMITVSGHRNVFRGCHFSGPNDTTQSASANYTGFTLSGTASHNYFKDCTFGGFNAVKRGANAQLTISSTGQGNVFEDCLFICGAAASTTEFIDYSSAAGTGGRVGAFFFNCQFVNMYEAGTGGSCKIADAIVIGTLTEASDARLFFDSRCTFSGVTDIAVAGKEECIRFGHSTIAYNVGSSSPDMKQLGLAMHPES